MPSLQILTTNNQIKSLLGNPRQGDVICIDLDQSFLLPDEEWKQIIIELQRLNESKIKIIGLMKHNNLSAINSELAGLLETVIGYEDNSLKSKAINFIQYVKHARLMIKRIMVIDQDHEFLEIFQNLVQNENKFPKFSLYNYQRLQHQALSSNESGRIPSSLDHYDAITSLGGGTNSTYKITSSQVKSLPPLVLKYGASQDAIKIELLCNLIYRFFNVRVPQRQAFNIIPKSIATQLNINQHGIFQISEFIEKNLVQDESSLIATAKSQFVIHALLGNIDITEEGNMFQGKDFREYILDAGSSFIFHALGELRSENAKIVSEVDSLRTFNATKILWFGDLTDQEITQQVISLIERETELEKFVWDAITKLKLSVELGNLFLQFLSDRIDNLALRFCPEIPRYAKIDRQVDPQQSAAGVLTYTIDKNETYILLAKRTSYQSDDVGLWDCFGGGSDLEDIHYHNTSSREVYEESSKHILHAPTALLNSPFHDIITNKNNKPFIYRLYLRKHKIVDTSRFNDHEHTDYQWVKVSELQKSLQKPAILDAHGRETTVIHTNKGQIILYPEFYQLLIQDAVRKNLARLNQFKPLRNTHTQSIAGQFQLSRVTRPHFQSPEEFSWQVIRSLLDHLAVMAELKDNAPTERDINNNAVQTFELTSDSQTELHMHSVLGHEYDPNDIHANVSAMIDKINNNNVFGLSPAEKNYLIEESIRLIEVERNIGDGKIIFYHSVSNGIAFVIEIYSLIQQQLQGNNQWHAFRYGNEHFKNFANIGAFIAFYMNLQNGNTKLDTLENYQETALSVNCSLFGNHKYDMECTFYYFLSNLTSRDVDLRGLLKTIFFSLKSPEIFIDQLIDIYEKYYSSNKAVIYQIIMDKQMADEYAHTAGDFGVLKPYQDSIELSTVWRLLRDDFNSGDEYKIEQATDYLSTMQARVMVPPHLPLTINTMTTNNVYGAQSKEKLNVFTQLIKELTFELMVNATDDSVHPHTPYKRILSHLADRTGITHKKNIPLSAIKRAIDNEQLNLIDSYLKENPSLAELMIGLCILTGNAAVAIHIIKLYPNLKDSSIKLPPSYIGQDKKAPEKPINFIDAIIEFGKNRTELLQAIYNDAWKEVLMHHDVWTETLKQNEKPEKKVLNVLTLLPPSSQADYIAIYIRAICKDFKMVGRKINNLFFEDLMMDTEFLTPDLVATVIAKLVPLYPELKTIKEFALNTFKHPPRFHKISLYILLYCRAKNSLLEHVYGENWRDVLTKDDLLECVNGITSLEQLISILRLLNFEQQQIIFEGCKDSSFMKDITYDAYIALLACLPTQLCEAVLSSPGVGSANFIRDASDFCKVCQDLFKTRQGQSADVLGIIYNKYLTVINSTIHTVDQLNTVLCSVKPDQCQIYFIEPNRKFFTNNNNLLYQLGSVQKYYMLIANFSAESYHSCCEIASFRETTMNCVTNIEAACRLFELINDEKNIDLAIAVYERNKAYLLTRIVSPQDFNKFAKCLQPYQASDLSDLIDFYVNEFRNNYSKYLSEQTFSFFKRNFLNQLDSTLGNLAKFCLIRNELSKPDSLIAKQLQGIFDQEIIDKRDYRLASNK